jgi:glucose/mannose transport system substrate-binding protein
MKPEGDGMNSSKMVLRAVVAALTLYGVVAHAEPLKANVIHWWTSGGESAAIRQFADAYDKAGGLWVDNAVAGADQARS